jgi:hypothetical protein
MPPSRFRRRRQPHIRNVVIGLGSPVGALTTLESLVGEVGGPRLGSPGHPHQVAGVLHGLGGSLQVPLYGPASDGPIAG